MLSLIPFRHKGEEWIAISGTFPGSVHSLIRTLPDRRYSRTHRCYYFPCTEQMFELIAKTLSTITQIDTSSFLTTTTALPDSIKRAHFVAIPENYEALLTRMRYAGATVKNYLVQFRYFVEFIYPT